MLIQSNTKVLLLDNQERKNTSAQENPRNSRKKIKYVYEIYLEHFKLKNFINKILPSLA